MDKTDIDRPKILAGNAWAMSFLADADETALDPHGFVAIPMPPTNAA